jgi:hypothetical protein
VASLTTSRHHKNINEKRLNNPKIKNPKAYLKLWKYITVLIGTKNTAEEINIGQGLSVTKW